MKGKADKSHFQCWWKRKKKKKLALYENQHTNGHKTAAKEKVSRHKKRKEIDSKDVLMRIDEKLQQQ